MVTGKSKGFAKRMTLIMCLATGDCTRNTSWKTSKGNLYFKSHQEEKGVWIQIYSTRKY